MRCLTETDLQALLEDSLPPDRAAASEEHVEQCVVCRGRLELLCQPIEPLQVRLSTYRDRGGSTAHGFWSTSSVVGSAALPHLLREALRGVGTDQPEAATTDVPIGKGNPDRPVEKGVSTVSATAESSSADRSYTTLLHRRSVRPPAVPPDDDQWTRLRAESPQRPHVPGYQILGLLGRGGMGVVYKARQIGLNRIVALKVLIDGSPLDVQRRQRFQIEAESSARLDHPHIVKIHDVGESAGQPYVTLEYLGGGTLAHRLKGRTMPSESAAALIQILARAVEAAHQAGILHRDLKPSNVLFDEHGTPKIADFSLAKWVDAEEGQTVTGQVMGTPSYMSPEQAQGDWSRVGVRSDLYALGAIYYECLTGRPPIRESSPPLTLCRVIDTEPIPPAEFARNLPRDLETIVLKCLAKDPTRRYANAGELADELERVLQGRPIHARRTPVWERAWKWARRRPGRAASAVASSLIAAVALVMAGWQYQAELQQQRRIERLRLEIEAQLADRIEPQIEQGQWLEARDALARLTATLEATPRLDDLSKAVAERQDDLTERIQRRRDHDADLKADETFHTFRDEALFLACSPFGADPEVVRMACRRALSVFGGDLGGDRWIPDDLPTTLDETRRNALQIQFQELQILLARSLAEGPEPIEPDALRALCDHVDLAFGPSLAIEQLRTEVVEVSGPQDRSPVTDERTPSTTLDWFLQGLAAYERSEVRAARLAFDRVIAQQPQHYWAHAMLARCHLRGDRPEPRAALAELALCEMARSGRATTRWQRGFAQIQLAARLMARYEQAVEVDEKNWLAAEIDAALDAADDDYRIVDVSGSSSETRYVVHVNRAQLLIERGRWQDLQGASLLRLIGRRPLPEAARELRIAIGLKPEATPAYLVLARVYDRMERPSEALQQIERALAVADSDEAADLGPLRIKHQLDLIEALERSDPRRDEVLVEALEAFDRAVETAIDQADPIQSDSISGLRGRERLVDLMKLARVGLVDADEPRFEPRWLAAAEAVLAIDPESVLAHAHHAKALMRGGPDRSSAQWATLRQDCRFVLAHDPDDAEIRVIRGLIRLLDGAPQAALDDFQLARLSDAPPSGLETLCGWAWLLSGQPEIALERFDVGLGQTPDDADALIGRARALIQTERVEEALVDVERALKQSWTNNGWLTRPSAMLTNAAWVYREAAQCLRDTEVTTMRRRVEIDRQWQRHQARARELDRMAQRAVLEERAAQRTQDDRPRSWSWTTSPIRESF